MPRGKRSTCVRSFVRPKPQDSSIHPSVKRFNFRTVRRDERVDHIRCWASRQSDLYGILGDNS